MNPSTGRVLLHRGTLTQAQPRNGTAVHFKQPDAQCAARCVCIDDQYRGRQSHRSRFDPPIGRARIERDKTMPVPGGCRPDGMSAPLHYATPPRCRRQTTEASRPGTPVAPSLRRKVAPTNAGPRPPCRSRLSLSAWRTNAAESGTTFVGQRRFDFNRQREPAALTACSDGSRPGALPGGGSTGAVSGSAPSRPVPATW